MVKVSGAAAERWVAQLLQQRGWRLLDSNWCCRWGELDLVLSKPSRLLVVEVKARRHLGLDRGGLAACGPAKRRCLGRALRCWLAAHPCYGEHSIQVVLALVRGGSLRCLTLSHLS